MIPIIIFAIITIVTIYLAISSQVFSKLKNKFGEVTVSLSIAIMAYLFLKLKLPIISVGLMIVLFAVLLTEK